MLYSIVNDPAGSAYELNGDLETIKAWALQWKMAFNPDPSKQAIELIFSQKKIKIAHPPLYFNDIQVKSVDYHKHLGLTLDTKLTFVHHINEERSLARKGIGVIKFMSS